MTPLVLANYNLTLEHLFRKSPIRRVEKRYLIPENWSAGIPVPLPIEAKEALPPEFSIKEERGIK